jgi:hypothetical protein
MFIIKYQYSEESVLLNVLDIANTPQWGKTCQHWGKTWMLFHLTKQNGIS